MTLTVSALLVVLALQDEPPLDAADPGRPAAASERYVGVVPGAATRNPLPAPAKQPPHLIWAGFQMAEGISRVFLQTTATVPYEVLAPEAGKAGKPTTISVLLRNCRIHLQNNRRHLDTRFFASPVRGVTARQRKKDVELRIELKESSSPTPRTEAGPDGTQFVVLEFAGGSPAAVAAPAAAALQPDPAK